MLPKQATLSVLLIASLSVIPMTAAGNLLEPRDAPTCTTTAVAPPPTGFICNTEGHLNNPSVLTSQKAANQTYCRDLCLNDKASCLAFSYGPRTACTTYNKKIAASGFVKGKTGKTFWNKHCYGSQCGLCPDGEQNCSGDCVDTRFDSANCGECGRDCGLYAHCFNYNCYCDQEPRSDTGECCPPDMPNCDGVCQATCD